MTSVQFCYWLQGFFELRAEHDVTANKNGLTESQAECIRKHLALVFIHEIDPSQGDSAHQAKLSAAHSGGTQPVSAIVSAAEKIGGTGPGGVLYRC